ncbi:MAG: MFS transporter [Firmicutes bacterium]|nr:MFS transporter [Bacillota bacterium]
MNTVPQRASHSRVSLWTMNFVIVFIINMLAFFGFYITTVGMPFYVASLGAGSLVIGLVTTLTATAAIIVRPFSGAAIDRLSRKVVLLLGLTIMAVSTLAYAVFPIIAIILGLRVLHGVGWGLGSTATSTLAADAIPKIRFAEGMGYVGLGTSLATAIAPSLATGLVQSQGSGIMAMIIIAAASSAGGFVLAFFQRPQKDQTKAELTKPKELNGVKLADFFDQRASLPSLAMFLSAIGYASIITFIAIHGQVRGVNHIYIYFLVYAVVTIISRPPIGKLIDRVGFFLPGTLSMLCIAISLVIISFATDIFIFCIAGIFAGIGMGTVITTMQTMAVSAVPPRRRGVATATFLLGFDGGVAVGSVVAGFIAGAFGYGIMYAVMAVFPFIGCVIFITLGNKRIARYSQQTVALEQQ